MGRCSSSGFWSKGSPPISGYQSGFRYPMRLPDGVLTVLWAALSPWRVERERFIGKSVLRGGRDCLMTSGDGRGPLGNPAVQSPEG